MPSHRINLAKELPLKILIAEDNVINQELMLAMFDKMGAIRQF
jgi:hypothetical protein